MSICRTWLHNTCNVLTLRRSSDDLLCVEWDVKPYTHSLMSSEQIHLQVSHKLFGVNKWIPQVIRQWIPDSWSGDRKCTGPKGATANLRNLQLMTSGRSQVLATSNFRDWHTVVGEIPMSSVLKITMDCHSKLVLHSLRKCATVIIRHSCRPDITICERKHVFAYFLFHVYLWIILDGARNIPIFSRYFRQHYQKIKLQFDVLKLRKRKPIATHINSCDDIMAKAGCVRKLQSYKKLKHLRIFAHWNLPCGISIGKSPKFYCNVHSIRLLLWPSALAYLSSDA